MSGGYPIIRVSTFLNDEEDAPSQVRAVTRSSDNLKKGQISRLKDFRSRHAHESRAMLSRLKEAAQNGTNIFEVLMDAVRCCSLGQITGALCEAGGQYRRNL